MGVDAVLFIAGGLILVFWAFPRAYAWIHVLGLRFRRPRVELTDPTTLPAPLRPVFEEIVQTLRELGFQYSHAQWTDGLVTHEGRRPYLVFVHPETNSYAAANPSALENGPRVFDVVFTTAYESGSVVATFDGVEHLALALPPTWECYDHFLNDPTEQWEAHRRAIASKPVTEVTVRYTPAEFVARDEAMLAEIPEHLERIGTLRRVRGREEWCLRSPAAWRFGQKMLGGVRRTGDAREGHETPRRASALNGEARVAAEVYAYERFEAAERRRPRSGLGRAISFVLGAGGFLVVFGWLFSWEMVPLLFLVVLFHELGHLAGMTLFGYRDRSVFFVPFLGGAAVGRKDDATAAQRVIVYLMGPLPGVVLGLVYLYLYLYAGPAWLAEGPTWVLELAVLALIVNYFNLLPFVPLDGGRIVETLFLSRLPQAQTLFLVFSAGLFALGALLLRDPILGLLTALTAIAIPAKWRWGKMARRVAGRVPPEAARTEKLVAVFRLLNEAAYASLSRARRFLLAKGVLTHLEARPPTLAVALGGAALYGALLLGPVAGYGYLVVRQVVPSLWGGNGLRTSWELTPERLGALADDEVEAAVIEEVFMLLGGFDGDWERTRQALPEGARIVYTAWQLEVDVSNGGFLQYFWDTEGRDVGETHEALLTIGAVQHAALFARAAAVDSAESGSRAKLRAKGDWHAFQRAARQTELGELDEEFDSLSDALSPLRLRYIREHPEAFRSE
jgi:Zn-dependent protease